MSTFQLGQDILRDEDDPPSSGTPGAVSQEQIDAIVEKVVGRLSGSVDAAITSRLGSREQLRAIQELPSAVQALTEKFESVAPPNGKAPSDGKGKKVDAQTAEELDAERKARIALEKRLHNRDRNDALRRELGRLVQEGKLLPDAIEDTMELLAGRKDFESAQDATGVVTWTGKAPNELGDVVTVPMSQAIEKFVAARPRLQPPVSEGGSGASGGSGPGGSQSPVNLAPGTVSEEQLRGMSDEQFDEWWLKHGGQKPRGERGSAWSMG